MTTLIQQDIQKSGRLLAFQPPPHWRVIPLGYLFESVGGATPSKENEEYWSGKIPWVSPKDMKSDVITGSEDHISEAALNETRLALLPASTILVVVRGMILVHTIPIAVTAIETTINQDMKGLFSKKGVTPEYFALLLRSVSSALFSTIEESGHGTRCLRLDLWRNILVGVPPEDEQQLIVQFVEEQSLHLDALMAKKQKMIDLLHEKRQALISEAVTKGIDPDVPRKDSGFPWLGSVPAHWSVERLRWRLRRVGQGWSPQCEGRRADPGEWGVLKVGCMNSGTFDESENKALPSDLAPLPELEIRVGDVLMSRSNTVELVGAVGMVHQTQGRILLCDKLYRLEFDRSMLLPSYSVHLLRSRTARLQIERDATGASSSMKNISNEIVANMVFAFPPFDEQWRINEFIEAELRRLEFLEKTISTQIERLREYRQTLISDAVTGKIDLMTGVLP